MIALDEEQATALRQNFLNDIKYMENVLVVAVQLPGGAIEVIQNFQQLNAKADYYKFAYDEQFRLKVNPAVRIVSFMAV